jgi:thioredoxin 2
MATGRMDARGVIVTCASCGQGNRLPFGALTKSIRCGSCKNLLGPAATPVEAPDAATFHAAARDSALPLIVDFWAPWCGPCRMVAPELERVAQAAAGRYLVVKVNTDDLQEIGQEFRIRSIPTLAIVFRGDELARIAGARSAAEIRTFADQTIAEAQRRAS